MKKEVGFNDENNFCEAMIEGVEGEDVAVIEAMAQAAHVGLEIYAMKSGEFDECNFRVLMGKSDIGRIEYNFIRQNLIHMGWT